MRITLRALGVVASALALSAASTSAQPTEHRVVLKLDGMADAIVRADIPFKTTGDKTLALDLYLPPNHDERSPLPVVIFANGAGDPPNGAPPAKEWGQYTDWPRLVTTLGFAAVSHNARFGHLDQDVRDLLDYVIENADALGVDALQDACPSAAAVQGGL